MYLERSLIISYGLYIIACRVLEKVDYFEKLLGPYNRGLVDGQKVAVRGVFGERGMPRFCREQIVVCTIEKANVVLNSFLVPGSSSGPSSADSTGMGIGTVGCVAVDELHMMGDGHRGYQLEILVR